MTFLPNMMGNEMPARIQGIVLSILLARASSMAPALHGFTKMLLGFGWAGEPGCADEDVVFPSLSTATRSDGESSGDEKERRYRAMKKSSLSAQKRNSTTCSDFPVLANDYGPRQGRMTDGKRTYLIRVVQMQNPAATRLDLLMTLPAGGERRVHVNIVAREIQTDQALEHDGPARERRGQEHQQT